ncbi:hypothetical protein D3C81_1226960 [compost metagenome]
MQLSLHGCRLFLYLHIVQYGFIQYRFIQHSLVQYWLDWLVQQRCCQRIFAGQVFTQAQIEGVVQVRLIKRRNLGEGVDFRLGDVIQLGFCLCDSVGLILQLWFNFWLGLRRLLCHFLGNDVFNHRCLRLILQQALHVLLIHLSSQRCRAHTGGGHTQHGWVAPFELLDLRGVVLGGRQDALLLDESTVITLAGIHFHQLQAQRVTTGFCSERCFEQLGGMIQTTTLQALLDFRQQRGGGIWLRLCVADRRCGFFRGSGGGGRGRDYCWRQRYARRRDLQPFKAVGGHLQPLDRLFFSQGPRHAQVFLCLFLGLALAHQQHQQKQ